MNLHAKFEIELQMKTISLSHCKSLKIRLLPILASDNLVLQEKDEPGTERDLIQGQPLNLISTEDGLHVRTLDNNNLAETESEHGMESLSPRSENEVLRSYEAAAADGDSYKQIDHLENAVQKYKTENQILKARKVASDDASHVDDHHEQPSK